MARGTKKPVWIEFGADVKKLRAGVMSVNAMMNKVGRSIHRHSRGFMVAGAAIGAGLGAAVKAASDFQQSMANMASVARPTQDELQKLNKFALELGRTLPASSKDAADAMYWLASAGQKTNEIMKTLPGTIKLAAATQFDLAATTEMVVATLNSFGYEAGQTERVVNTLAATIGNSLANMTKLTESMKYAGAPMKAVGKDIEETSAALGIFYNAGLQGSQAGTALRAILARLIKPNDEFRGALSKLNLSMEDVDINSRSLSEIFGTLKDAGFGAEEALAMFGRRAFTGALALGEYSDELRWLEEEVTNTTDAQDMMETQMDTLAGQTKLLKDNIVNLGIELAMGALPRIQEFTTGLKNATVKLQETSGATKDLWLQLAALTAGTLTLIGVVGRLAPLIGTTMAGSLGVGLVAVGVLVAAFVTLDNRLSTVSSRLAHLTTRQQEHSVSVKELGARYEYLEEKAARTKEEEAELVGITEQLIKLVPELNGYTAEQARIFADVAVAAKNYSDEMGRALEAGIGSLMGQYKRLGQSIVALEAVKIRLIEAGYKPERQEMMNVLDGLVMLRSEYTAAEQAIMNYANVKFPAPPSDWGPEYSDDFMRFLLTVRKIGDEVPTALDDTTASLTRLREAAGILIEGMGLDALADAGGRVGEVAVPALEETRIAIEALAHPLEGVNTGVMKIALTFYDFFKKNAPQIFRTFGNAISHVFTTIELRNLKFWKSMKKAWAESLKAVFGKFLDEKFAELAVSFFTEQGKIVMSAFANPLNLLKLVGLTAAYGVAKSALAGFESFAGGGIVTEKALVPAGAYAGIYDAGDTMFGPSAMKEILSGAGFGARVTITQNFNGDAPDADDLGDANSNLIDDIRDAMARSA